MFIPFTIGGGLRSDEDVRRVLAAGADKVTVNTAAVEDPELVRRCAERFGSQCMVLAIDAKRRTPGAARWEVYVHGGRTPTGMDAEEWAVRAAELGAGEIMLTSMDRDGTLDGYDLELTRTIARAVDVPVIASGGVGTLEHLARGLLEGEADAVLAASIFHYGTYTIAAAKEYLAGRGVHVRPIAGGAPAGSAGAERAAAGRVVGVTGQQRIDLASLTPAESLRVTAAVAAARLVCFPTDTVYGVGGVLDPAVGDAIQAAKGRAADKPLQVIFPTREVLLAEHPRRRPLARRVLPFAPGAGDARHPLSGGLRLSSARRGHTRHPIGFKSRRREQVVQTLGVRVPRWPAGARLLATLPYPLLASSANPSGVAAEAGRWTRSTPACWPPATCCWTAGRQAAAPPRCSTSAAMKREEVGRSCAQGSGTSPRSPRCSHAGAMICHDHDDAQDVPGGRVH